MPVLTAFALGLIAIPLARWAGLRLGIVDRPNSGQLKIHDRATPVLGGVGVLGAAFAGLAVIGLHLPWMVIGGIAVATVAGLIDDVRSLHPAARLVALSAAAALVAAAVHLTALGAFGGIVAFVVVIGTANGVNLLDGQDGLVAGLATVASVGLWASAAGGVDRAGLALAGGLMAFLLWNRPPARLFLGNAGAYGVGVYLATLALHLVSERGWPGLLGAGACLGIVVLELADAVFRRLRSRVRVTLGDRNHTYDRLAARVGRGRSTLILWALGTFVAAAGVLAARSGVELGSALVVISYGVIGTVLLLNRAESRPAAAPMVADR